MAEVGVEGGLFWFSWSPRARVAYQIASPGRPMSMMMSKD